MFFCLPNEVTPAGVFSVGHLVLFLVTVSLIAAGLFFSRRMGERGVRRTVRAVTGLLWALEIAKIVFVLAVTGSRNPNDFVPFYYCSLVLYAGLLSSLGRGAVRRCGDVFLAVGSLIGGAFFLVYPSTSLPRYPTVHFISFHSFLLHGLMVFLALLLLSRGGIRLSLKDLKYQAILVSAVCVAALIVNIPTGSNLMFISEDFPGTPLHLIYSITGGGVLYTAVMWVGQATLPFLIPYPVLALLQGRLGKKK